MVIALVLKNAVGLVLTEVMLGLPAALAASGWLIQTVHDVIFRSISRDGKERDV